MFLWKSLAAGGLAGALPTMLLYPREVIHTQQVVFGESFKESFAHARKQTGMRGLYGGFCSSVFGSFMYRAAYFGGFNYAKHEYYDNFPSLSYKQKFPIVYCISLAAALLSYPIDTIRRRIAVQQGRGQQVYKGAISTVLKLLKLEGVRSLFKGSSFLVLKALPAALMLLAYDQYKVGMSCDAEVPITIAEPSSSRVPQKKDVDEFHFILPLDYQIEPALLLDYERELGLTSIKGVIDFYNKYFDDKANWEEIGKTPLSHIWNYKKGTPFNKD